jgi:hypothetical protein
MACAVSILLHPVGCTILCRIVISSSMTTVFAEVEPISIPIRYFIGHTLQTCPWSAPSLRFTRIARNAEHVGEYRMKHPS